MSESSLTNFACPFCNVELDVRLPKEPKVVNCPACSKPLKLPAREPAVVPVDSDPVDIPEPTSVPLQPESFAPEPEPTDVPVESKPQDPKPKQKMIRVPTKLRAPETKTTSDTKQTEAQDPKQKMIRVPSKPRDPDTKIATDAKQTKPKKAELEPSVPGVETVDPSIPKPDKSVDQVKMTENLVHRKQLKKTEIFRKSMVPNKKPDEAGELEETVKPEESKRTASSAGERVVAKEGEELIRKVKAAQKRKFGPALWIFAPMAIITSIALIVMLLKDDGKKNTNARIVIGANGVERQGVASSPRVWRANGESEAVPLAFAGRKGGEILDMVVRDDGRLVATGVFPSSHAVPHGRVATVYEHLASKRAGPIPFVAQYSADRKRMDWIVEFGAGMLKPARIALGYDGGVVLAGTSLGGLKTVEKGDCVILKLSRGGDTVEWVRSSGDSAGTISGLTVDRLGRVLWLSGDAGEDRRGFVLQ